MLLKLTWHAIRTNNLLLIIYLTLNKKEILMIILSKEAKEVKGTKEDKEDKEDRVDKVDKEVRVAKIMTMMMTISSTEPINDRKRK